VIQEGRLRGDRSGRHDVPVGEDEAALRIDHEAGGLRRYVALGIEGARLIDLGSPPRCPRFAPAWPPNRLAEASVADTGTAAAPGT